MVPNVFHALQRYTDPRQEGEEYCAPALYGGRQPPQPLPLEGDALRSVFLFTDGLANEGITDAATLVGFVRGLCVYVCVCVCLLLLTFFLGMGQLLCVQV
jgi:hypothetical protein